MEISIITKWGSSIPQEPQEFEAITGFSHHFHTVHPLNNTSDTPAKHYVVISQQNRERAFHRSPPFITCGRCGKGGPNLLPPVVPVNGAKSRTVTVFGLTRSAPRERRS